MNDIEGPNVNQTFVLALGARPIYGGHYDINIVGKLAGVVFLPGSAAPLGFPSCVLSCLESMTVNTTGFSINVLSFNVSSRRLLLSGQGSDTTYQSVLRTTQYLNKARLPNIYSINMTIYDGVQSTTTTFHVYVVEGNRRRRDTISSFARRRLLSIPETEDSVSKHSSNVASAYSNGMTWVIIGTVVTMMIVVAIFAFLRKRQASSARK